MSQIPPAGPHTLPDLPYGHDALEPAIDAATMRVHHGKHHQAYVTNLNAALGGTEFAERPLDEVLGDLDALPEGIRAKVRNNGGGHLNHAIFWTTMTPGGSGGPAGEIAAAIERDFGSFEAFKSQFEAAATGQFGSGWAWLATTPEGALHVHGMPNQDNPVMHGDHPLLGVDVWEHAYYLHYQNRRADYVQAWWGVVNWTEVDRRYRSALAQEVG